MCQVLAYQQSRQPHGPAQGPQAISSPWPELAPGPGLTYWLVDASPGTSWNLNPLTSKPALAWQLPGVSLTAALRPGPTNQ